MSRLHVKYLLVGGGLASSAAAEAIRALDANGSILMLGQEPVRPYHRSPLSKSFMRRECSRAELFAREPEWFNANGVELRTGRRVAHLDVGRRTASIDNGDEISYDQLLLATGAAARHLTIPGAQLQNVFHLRTLGDAEMLQNAVAKAKNEGRGRATIVGGGLLGLELASTLTGMGLTIDLIVGDEHPWKNIVGETTGRFLTRHLQSKYVNVHVGQRPMRLEGDGRVQRVVLPEGQPIGCDFVVAAIGSIVPRDLLRGTPIAAEKAILADARCRTNVDAVYAAGDCAAVFDPLFGKHRWIDHWENAIVTGRIAGTNMAGGDARYDVVNTFASEVFDLTLTVWGSPKHVERRLLRGAPAAETPDFAEIGIAADGKVSQVVAMNGSKEHAALCELVRTRANVTGEEDALRDAAMALPSIL
ncbi:MAG: NAD(P)/FAD-dependent oxidoreductase [Planctomycetota bacterium]|nr:NAD(P)/FAD-dependent oxidoreductase [Planctomycetota bacterium]